MQQRTTKTIYPSKQYIYESVKKITLNHKFRITDYSSIDTALRDDCSKLQWGEERALTDKRLCSHWLSPSLGFELHICKSERRVARKRGYRANTTDAIAHNHTQFIGNVRYRSQQKM